MKRFRNEDDEADWADHQNDIMRSEPDYKTAYERYKERTKKREHLIQEIKEPGKADIAFAWLVVKAFGALSWLLRIPCLWILLTFGLLLVIAVAFAQVWRMIYGF